LYNISGNHILEYNYNTPFDSNGLEWYIPINKSLINKEGIYSILFNCNNSKDAGTHQERFEITSDGREQKKSEYLFLLVLLSIFILLWVLKYISETLSKKHEILKGLLIVNMVLLSILGIFISFFMAIGNYYTQIEILQKNILVILTIFASCISAYFLIMWIISLNIKNKNKYGNNK